MRTLHIRGLRTTNPRKQREDIHTKGKVRPSRDVHYKPGSKTGGGPRGMCLSNPIAIHDTDMIQTCVTIPVVNAEEDNYKPHSESG
jgi:hypothetical protein